MTCGYQLGPLPHIRECRWCGDISQRCLNPYSRFYGEACCKPWLQADFDTEAAKGDGHKKLFT